METIRNKIELNNVYLRASLQLKFNWFENRLKKDLTTIAFIFYLNILIWIIVKLL